MGNPETTIWNPEKTTGGDWTPAVPLPFGGQRPPLQEEAGKMPAIQATSLDLAPPFPDRLDLSVPQRFVELVVGKAHFTHFFQSPTADDWIEYERALRPTLVFGDEQVESRVHQREAALALWAKSIVRVEGYPGLVAAVSDRRSVENWKDAIPLEHQVRAIQGLDRVQPGEDQDVLGDGETTVVRLTAWWNGIYFDRLLHRFTRPLVEHELRFREALERRAIVTPKIGGQRKAGKQPVESRSLPQLPTLIALYDELIVSVEGYTSPDVILNKAKDLMDVPHKSAAVRALFAPQVVEIYEPENPDAGR